MTNSKQYCDYCGERWSALHNACAPQRPPYLQYKYMRLFKDGKKVSTVRLEENDTLIEIYPERGAVFKTGTEWKEKYPGAKEE